ncbi:MAG: maleylpyruvate isomerase N-terminal domain-containing protein [Dehalococcoidia bacterium]
MLDNPEATETKHAVIAAIDDAWRDLRRCLSPLTGPEMIIPGVCGEWSVKDVLAHITTWESELIMALGRGSAVPTPNLDEFNEKAVRSRASLTSREVMEQLEDTHRSLRDALNDAPAAYFAYGESIRTKIDSDSLLHYEEHAAQIRAWVLGRRRAKRVGQG